MERSEDFQNVVAHIKQLEDYLLSLEDAEKNAKYGEELEREVEEHFMSCINALAARKESLLRELGEQIYIQSILPLPLPPSCPSYSCIPSLLVPLRLPSLYSPRYLMLVNRAESG